MKAEERAVSETTPAARKLYGFYSAVQAERCGSCIYRTPDGREIEVTSVSSGKPPSWDDTVALGEVVPVEAGGFVRRVSYGKSGLQTIEEPRSWSRR